MVKMVNFFMYILPKRRKKVYALVILINITIYLSFKMIVIQKNTCLL